MVWEGPGKAKQQQEGITPRSWVTPLGCMTLLHMLAGGATIKVGTQELLDVFMWVGVWAWVWVQVWGWWWWWGCMCMYVHVGGGIGGFGSGGGCVCTALYGCHVYMALRQLIAFATPPSSFKQEKSCSGWGARKHECLRCTTSGPTFFLP